MEKHRQKLRHDSRTEKTGEECRRSKVGKSGKDERGKGVIRRRESEREKKLSEIRHKRPLVEIFFIVPVMPMKF